MKKRCLVSFFICMLFLLHIVSAFAVTTIYSKNYPLRMLPGEEKETFFLVSNIVEGDSDAVIRSELLNGKEIASLIDGDILYDLPFGREVEVPVKIKIPENAAPGTEYSVGVIFMPSPRDEGFGNVQLLVNLGKSFPVKVIGDIEEKNEIEESDEPFTLTLKEEPEEVVEDFAPPNVSNAAESVWIGLIFVLSISTIVVFVLVIYLLFRTNRNTEDYFFENPQYLQ